MSAATNVKVVGKVRVPEGPIESFWRGHALQQQTDKLNPYPRPRGFVVKFKTYEDYERWKSAQANPRLW